MEKLLKVGDLLLVRNTQIITSSTLERSSKFGAGCPSNHNTSNLGHTPQTVATDNEIPVHGNDEYHMAVNNCLSQSRANYAGCESDTCT
jgi:hypothetical protein